MRAARVAKNCIVTSGRKIMLINKNVESLFAKFQETRQHGENANWNLSKIVCDWNVNFTWIHISFKSVLTVAISSVGLARQVWTMSRLGQNWGNGDGCKVEAGPKSYLNVLNHTLLYKIIPAIPYNNLPYQIILYHTPQHCTNFFLKPSHYSSFIWYTKWPPFCTVKPYKNIAITW